MRHGELFGELCSTRVRHPHNHNKSRARLPGSRQPQLGSGHIEQRTVAARLHRIRERIHRVRIHRAQHAHHHIRRRRRRRIRRRRQAHVRRHHIRCVCRFAGLSMSKDHQQRDPQLTFADRERLAERAAVLVVRLDRHRQCIAAQAGHIAAQLVAHNHKLGLIRSAHNRVHEALATVGVAARQRANHAARRQRWRVRRTRQHNVAGRNIRCTEDRKRPSVSDVRL